ncbi:MAG: helix-turn-helix transcriptional regulator [Planctomycetes bacterium]|nr:helix-turn-helix transcriptional regulator [Planctomycetota bacterium]
MVISIAIAMPERKIWLSMTEALREAIATGPSLREIERRTGVKRQTLAKFVRREQSLRLDFADKLATYFGIEVVRKGK